MLLRDITAETRHRDELAGFAGVVAHDLLNPLTTVEGWTEAAADTAVGVTPHITVASSREGDTVTVTIADNGIGIPAGQHDAVFDTFHRAHRGQGYGGTGLGPAICKRTVERHGGTITATDNPGGGTRFTFTLPAETSIDVTTLNAYAGTGAVGSRTDRSRESGSVT
ncbi:hypothetical protein GCM10010112_16260 [Actinoplanes lobatus]|uniref:Sensor-like histidine kinase SenX3 n=1 Tax=Actinoplanes lobatus TaxID=113568 RepID=A0A7W7H9N3_9ACTN|nr:ATP-binding protein [Actinoplanes lobatus]MBB4746412.1 signal transduction histidine kinase [Actinoplanes lobatus]GGN60226.1 hypothetical protein GCM10010112_16260 [Actinoplanes lobatus]GIE41300.1 hypothetical protein Alo02nite_41980 [Actinoplanes lobatus]